MPGRAAPIALCLVLLGGCAGATRTDPAVSVTRANHLLEVFSNSCLATNAEEGAARAAFRRNGLTQQSTHYGTDTYSSEDRIYSGTAGRLIEDGVNGAVCEVSATGVSPADGLRVQASAVRQRIGTYEGNIGVSAMDGQIQFSRPIGGGRSEIVSLLTGRSAATGMELSSLALFRGRIAEGET